LAAQLDETVGLRTRRTFNKDTHVWPVFKAEPLPVVPEPAVVVNTAAVLTQFKTCMPKTARLLEACADADSLYYFYKNVRRKQNPPLAVEALPRNPELDAAAETARGNRAEMNTLKYCVAASLLERGEDAPQLFNLWKHNLKTLPL
jgi:hypothetical protein